MKKLSLLLVLVIILGAFSSCGARGERFELTYESDRETYLVGETVKITAKVTNISGKTYRYEGSSSDYRPYVRLYPVLDDNHLGEPLEHLPIASTDDAPSWHNIRDGGSGQVTFEFPLSEDAYIGKYTVELSYGDEIEVFPGVLTVLKPSAQNEKDGLRYSSVTVSSGGEGVHPLSGMSYSNQYLNGEPALCADGKGVYWFFDDPELDHNDFPCLVLDGEIVVSATDKVKTGSIRLYDLNYGEIEYTGGFNGLSYLPSGEYLVVFDEYHDGSLDDPNAEEYWITCYEDLFKLVVRNNADDYEYSSTAIISGSSEIYPIKLRIGYSEYKNGKLVDAVEIAGYEFIFNSDKYNVSEFPTIVLRGKITDRPPVNVKIYGIAIYDTDYNRLEYSFDSLTALSELPRGEYVVVYYEEAHSGGCDPEIKDFRISKNAGVFKLVIQK